MFTMPQMNDQVRVQDLVALNQAIRKATEAGYQTPAGLGTGSMSALVPQSLEGTLASTTFTMAELALWPMIPKRSVSQTVHEFTRIEEHGHDFDAFIAAFRVLPVTEEIARHGGLHRRDYGHSHGTGLVNGIIAATALQIGSGLVTLNLRHYPMLDAVLVPY